VNDHLCAVTRWTREELIGRSLLGTLADDPPVFEEFRTRMRDASVPPHVERRMRTRAGEELTIAWSDAMIRDRAGRVVGVTGIGEDITGRRRAERRIAYLSRHDELTGLPNRVAFSERAAEAVALAEQHGRSIGMLFVDVDNFTLVNDGYSHAAGDELLRQLAERLSAVGRDAEIVARHSGDEFLVLLADTAGPGASARTHDTVEQVTELANVTAERIRAALRSPFMVGDDPVYLAVQIGVSVFPRDARDTNQLLSEAHIASYGPAHRAGPSSGDSTGLPARDELRMISQLHQAIERDELELHYQPVVELGSRRMRGVEALLRWRSPDGVVPPNTFIPLAERTGLIAPITEWVVERVCRQRVEWAARGIDLEMALNFPAALWEPAVIRDLLATIDRHGVDPADLLVEITESTAMMETTDSEALIELITSSGLRLAIDDFGTGYSSLSRLKQLPCRTLKVDRSFVRDLPGDADSAAMTVAIVQLAGNLGLEALAEGIETEDQAAVLASLGCDVGQGFLFGRPLPADQLEALWRQRLRRAA
jgi:diguanylate cyclase (GGDEF)-like protein/PAS domain S-box-containing protein